jgi:hypothetical protein
MLCAHDSTGTRPDRRSAAEDGSRDESNDQPDREGLDKGICHVDQRVLIQLRRALNRSDLRRNGGRVKSGGLYFMNLRREIAIHEVRHEVEIKDLPHGDVAEAGDERDQDATGKGAAEGDSTGELVVAITADAEVNQQERRDHDGIAQSHTVGGADLVGEQKRTPHKRGDDGTGDEAEGEDGFLHVGLPDASEDGLTVRSNGASCRHPFE